MSSQFAKSYAEALFDLALENNNLQTIHEQMTVLINLVNENSELIKILSHPQLIKEDKKKIIHDIFGKFDKNIYHFLLVLIDNNRFDGLFDINEAFTVLYNEYQNIIHVKAITTVALDKTQIDRLKVKLMIKYRHKIEINNILDESIVGGMRLIIKEDVIDYTITSQIKNLKSHVLKQI